MTESDMDLDSLSTVFSAIAGDTTPHNAEITLNTDTGRFGYGSALTPHDENEITVLDMQFGGGDGWLWDDSSDLATFVDTNDSGWIWSEWIGPALDGAMSNDN